MLEEIDLQVQRMLRRVNRQTLRHLDGSYQVATKSSYSDLVTTIDRQNEQEIDRQLGLNESVLRTKLLRRDEK